MMDILNMQGYAPVEVWGFLAPIQIAEQRSAKRLRKVEQDELYDKRVGAIETLPRLMEQASSFCLYNNSFNNGFPQDILSSNSFCREGVVRILSYLNEEIAYFANHPLTRPRELATRYEQALDALMQTPKIIGAAGGEVAIKSIRSQRQHTVANPAGPGQS